MNFLLTGGSACGKSTYAERIVTSFPKPRIYIATMRPYGEESLRKIRRHREMRAPKGFDTLECQTGVDRADIPQGSTVLLECICNLLANEMFDDQGNMLDVTESVIDEVCALSRKCENLVVVTNDVGSSYEDYNEGTQAYMRTVGQINMALAAKFDNVYELVCGIPLVLKGQLPEGLR